MTTTQPVPGTTDYNVSVGMQANRVYTQRGVQVHRGFTAVVRLRGDRATYRPGTWHQKRKAAQVTGERYARWLLRQRAAGVDLAQYATPRR